MSISTSANSKDLQSPHPVTALQKTMAEKSIKMINENNPIMAHKFGADPAVLTYKDTVYVYSTNDTQQVEAVDGKLDNNYGKITSLNVFSSKDLVNWTDLGIVPVAGRNGGTGDAKWANNSWAPAVCWKNIDGKDKFFIYFADNGSGIGVLTADSPTGPFTDPLQTQLISRQTPNCANIIWLFDPAVFVDDDGKAYLYFGGGHSPENPQHPKTARCVQLADDMISIVGEPKEIDAPWLFEDSGINKINGKYYYSYCANWTDRKGETGPEVPPVAVIAYMTSDSPLGPFTYQGYTLKNPGEYFGPWGNNHHWIFSFKDKWYIAYHTQTLEKGILEKGGYRCLFIDNFEINSDGSLPIQKASKKGVDQIAAFNPYEEVPAATFHSSKGIAVTNWQTLQSLSDNAWLCIKGADLSKGGDLFEANVIPGKNGGSIEILAGGFGGNGTSLGTVKVGKKDTKVSGKIKIPEGTGTTNLYLNLKGDFQLVSWKIDLKKN